MANPGIAIVYVTCLLTFQAFQALFIPFLIGTGTALESSGPLAAAVMAVEIFSFGASSNDSLPAAGPAKQRRTPTGRRINRGQPGTDFKTAQITLKAYNLSANNPDSALNNSSLFK